ncbi:hypothetical protein BDZ91DRAFT_739526 [Kalaharituber pfeilii]|nr:hypothetical protein BDZ91DRAFT_739526 [Kalaharituber pfeilii]
MLPPPSLPILTLILILAPHSSLHCSFPPARSPLPRPRAPSSATCMFKIRRSPLSTNRTSCSRGNESGRQCICICGTLSTRNSQKLDLHHVRLVSHRSGYIYLYTSQSAGTARGTTAICVL